MSGMTDDVERRFKALEARVAKLEKKPVRKRASPYDASASRGRTCSCGCDYRYLPGECKFGNEHGPS
jgi:hypothetical protein